MFHRVSALLLFGVTSDPLFTSLKWFLVLAI